MLVLTRRFGQAITIGDDIRIRFCSFNHGISELEIDAPRNMKMSRKWTEGNTAEVLSIDGIKIIIAKSGKHSNQIKIGIDAPKNIAVHREEIYDRINGSFG